MTTKLTQAQRRALHNVQTSKVTGLFGASSVKMKRALESLGLIVVSESGKPSITEAGIEALKQG
jgi:Mn-dependent DtxR family transcriptional regulator